MSDRKGKISSLKNRCLPYVPAVAAGVIVGAVIVLKLHPKMKLSYDEVLSPITIKSLKDHGNAMIHIVENDQFVDLIDWAHPEMQKK